MLELEHTKYRVAQTNSTKQPWSPLEYLTKTPCAPPWPPIECLSLPVHGHAIFPLGHSLCRFQKEILLNGRLSLKDPLPPLPPRPYQSFVVTGPVSVLHELVLEPARPN